MFAIFGFLILIVGLVIGYFVSNNWVMKKVTRDGYGEDVRSTMSIMTWACILPAVLPMVFSLMWSDVDVPYAMLRSAMWTVLVVAFSVATTFWGNIFSYVAGHFVIPQSVTVACGLFVVRGMIISFILFVSSFFVAFIGWIIPIVGGSL